ncbi:hypothetical protein L3V82_10015 [Thiotrichales bacterium 19S3-7]|nr:hypothetical protein [Thiotrichales bacterium 19S3-7]MCF6802494.1 hypothetical protein [Thiotrichales bacterium 19S3-11]
MFEEKSWHRRTSENIPAEALHNRSVYYSTHDLKELQYKRLTVLMAITADTINYFKELTRHAVLPQFNIKMYDDNYRYKDSRRAWLAEIVKPLVGDIKDNNPETILAVNQMLDRGGVPISEHSCKAILHGLNLRCKNATPSEVADQEYEIAKSFRASGEILGDVFHCLNMSLHKLYASTQYYQLRKAGITPSTTPYTNSEPDKLFSSLEMGAVTNPSEELAHE